MFAACVGRKVRTLADLLDRLGNPTDVLPAAHRLFLDWLLWGHHQEAQDAALCIAEAAEKLTEK